LIREYLVKPENSLAATLQLMNEIEVRAVTNDNFRLIINSLFGEHKRNKFQLYFLLWHFIRTHFKYVDDRFDEEIKNPLLMFKYKTGDCDDFSLFIKAALNVLGIRSSYLLLGQQENKFTHIVVITNCGVKIDGSNEMFNWIHPKYKFKKVI
jgi:hypothetical protein